MNPRDVVLVCLLAVPIGLAIGYGAAVLWDRIERLDWPRRD